LEGARRDVEELGGKALVLPTDVADADQVEAAAARVEETFGPIGSLGKRRDDLGLLSDLGDDTRGV
jgi:NAD(P)-dependent dehydrogenase (short-subunit alcohol dehydrogenase family)